MTGGCESTGMAGLAYYDEDGHFHYWDPNTATCHYQCSRGHVITVVSGPSITNPNKE